MRSSIYLLLCSVEAARGTSDWRWWVISLFPSLSCFTHRLTLLAPMQTYPYSCWSCASISEGGNLLFNKTTCLWTVMQSPLFARHFHTLKNDHMTGARMHFSLRREMKDGTSCHISRITMHTIPDLTQFKVTELRIYEILNRARQIWHNNIFFWKAHRIFPCGNENAVRRLWRKKTARRLHRRQCSDVTQTRFQCVGIWI